MGVTRPDAGFNLVFLRTGLPSFTPAAPAGHDADGLLVVVGDVDAAMREMKRSPSSGSLHRQLASLRQQIRKT